MRIFVTAAQGVLENPIANMLAAYYSKEASSEEMFSDLEIGKTEDFVFFY